jgi:starvation-inducible DNA-binding protein
MATKSKNNNVKIGITDEHRQDVANELQLLLADEHVLYVKTRNFHWNVEGLEFGVLHKFFEEQYNLLGDWIDEIAERIRYIGHYSTGSMYEFLQNTRLQEDNGGKLPATQMLQKLLDDHQSIIRSIRESIDKVQDKDDDVGTGDFLTEILQKHEKIAWMIRAHLAQ